MAMRKYADVQPDSVEIIKGQELLEMQANLQRLGKVRVSDLSPEERKNVLPNHASD